MTRSLDEALTIRIRTIRADNLARNVQTMQHYTYKVCRTVGKVADTAIKQVATSHDFLRFTLHREPSVPFVISSADIRRYNLNK